MKVVAWFDTLEEAEMYVNLHDNLFNESEE